LAGGRLKWQNGNWFHPDSGHIVPLSEVYIDSMKRGWHRVTDYQFLMLDALLADLRGQLQLLAGLTAAPDGDYGANGVAYYAKRDANPVVGHVTLDPINKLDPGPQVMAHLRATT
jgi:hypothetical protein